MPERTAGSSDDGLKLLYSLAAMSWGLQKAWLGSADTASLAPLLAIAKWGTRQQEAAHQLEGYQRQRRFEHILSAAELEHLYLMLLFRGHLHLARQDTPVHTENPAQEDEQQRRQRQQQGQQGQPGQHALAAGSAFYQLLRMDPANPVYLLQHATCHETLNSRAGAASLLRAAMQAAGPAKGEGQPTAAGDLGVQGPPDWVHNRVRCNGCRSHLPRALPKCYAAMPCLARVIGSGKPTLVALCLQPWMFGGHPSHQSTSFLASGRGC